VTLSPKYKRYTILHSLNNWPVIYKGHTTMAKWPKSFTLPYLKKKAPKIPDYTCIQIDNIIEKLEDLQRNDKRLTKAQVTRLRNSLEKLRSSNNKLRQSGIFWYENL